MQLLILFSMFACFLCETALQSALHGECNKILDKLIVKAKNEFGNQLDPYSLPDFQFRFQWRTVSIFYPGQIRLYNGTISGLLSLQRVGDCIIELPDDKVIMITNITMEELGWEYVSNFNLFISKFPLTTIIGNIGRISAELNLETNKETVIVTKLKIYEMEDIEIEIKNIKILEYIIKILIKALLKFFKTRVQHALEIHLKEFINNEIKNVNITNFIIESTMP